MRELDQPLSAERINSKNCRKKRRGKNDRQENKKKPNPTDIHVGSRIRLRRNMLGMSQEKLGENLGITFQQIQKYEKGTNRVGASRLQAIASILDVPVSFFFEDAPGRNPVDPAAWRKATRPTSSSISSTAPKGLQLNRAFVKHHRPEGSAQVVELVKALAAEDEVE